MERITLEVNNRTAGKWKYTSRQQQKKIARMIGKVLDVLNKDVERKAFPVGYSRPFEKEAEKLYKKNVTEWPEYEKLLMQLRMEASDNGLTEEILEKILSGDD